LKNTNSEQIALEDISSVLTKYRNNIRVIDRSIEQGLTPEDIDVKININDLYALRGLKAIEQDIIYQIENRTELLGAVVEDVYKKEQLNAIIVISLTIIIGLFIFWVFATKVIRPVKHIANIMLKMSEDEIDAQINPLQECIDNDNTELGRMDNSLQIFKDNELKRQIAEKNHTFSSHRSFNRFSQQK
jgi:methyl-accepting chemotaxis protein